MKISENPILSEQQKTFLYHFSSSELRLTFCLNQAVALIITMTNQEDAAEDFIFQLSAQEDDDWRSQFVTSNSD